MRKLGKFQQKVYDFAISRGNNGVDWHEFFDKFSPYKRRAGERSGHFENWRVSQVLESLFLKGLLVSEKRVSEHGHPYTVTLAIKAEQA